MESQEQLEPEIEEPNIDDPNAFNEWLARYVQRPFRGFEDIKHEDGTPYSEEEQITATKNQLRKTVEDFSSPQMGKTPEQIKNLLIASVKTLHA